jgi:DNA ligase (NAD+)
MNKKTIQELEKLILYYKEKYYSGKAEISDEAFDKLEDELKKLDPQNPVLSLVGHKHSESQKKVQHQKKMLSLEKTYELEVLEKWISHEKVLSIFKIDGSSCSLIYKDGHLSLAKTRGDGQFGENISQKALFIPDIPKFIRGQRNIEVRGEVFCIEKNFFVLSSEMEHLGLEAPSSQRNIVAGILGRKENIQLARHLSFQAFDLIDDEDFETEHEKLDHLKQLGFQTPEYVVHENLKDLKLRVQETKDFMSAGDYLIDGLVFIYDRIKLHHELGETSHHPRYKIAFKFPGETKTALINNIEWNVSRNGTLTPVALINPVQLSGAIISRVTLHNFGLVQNFELKPGDKIEIIRSGEVIPKFLGVIEKSKGDFRFPESCPSCHSVLKINDIWLSCENPICPSKIKEEILNYIQKAGLDDISDKRLEEMINRGLVKNIPDLYTLAVVDFYKLEKVKEKLAKKMFDNIQKTKVQSLAKFISAIGIEGVSITKTEKIISHGIDTLDKFLHLKKENLLEIDGFAEKSSDTIINSLETKKKLINELLKAGVIVEDEKTSSGDGELRNLKFCFTGELSIPRSKIEKLIKNHGGSISGVSKNLNYLVTNETESSSSKFLKAKTLGIPIINEIQLMKMLEKKDDKS